MKYTEVNSSNIAEIIGKMSPDQVDQMNNKGIVFMGTDGLITKEFIDFVKELEFED